MAKTSILPKSTSKGAGTPASPKITITPLASSGEPAIGLNSANDYSLPAKQIPTDPRTGLAPKKA